MRWLAWTMLMAIAVGAGAAGVNGELNPVLRHPHGSAATPIAAVIVKLRSAGHSAQRAQVRPAQDRIAALTARTGLTLHAARSITDVLHVIHVQPAVTGEPIAATVERLRADPEVEYAEPDQRRYPHATTPNDALFSEQWYLQQSSAATPSALDAVTAWDTTTGGIGTTGTTGIVIADLDTGVRFEHPDLQWAGSGGRLLPGYTFISDTFVANDGDAQDTDASDPGDWVTQADSRQPECASLPTGSTFPIPSSWHGTRVSGLLGALSNNGTGIAGVTWSAWLLPVRVLGKCGGLDSDIITGMLWAAGIPVSGVPNNPYPARIENMSLGGTGTCPQLYADVIGQLTAKGVLVVASAGNEGGPVDAPANCAGVAGVAGLRHAGTKVGYSSLGPEIALGAPAGNCVNTTAGSPCLYPITSTTNQGTTTPGVDGYTDQTSNPNLGTSFSAPLVSGIAALMLAVNGNLTSAQLIARLKEGSQPFPQTSPGTVPAPPMCHVPTGPNDVQNSECICTLNGQTCGAGMASASGSVNAALRPIAAVRVPASVAPGMNVTLDASGSSTACNQTIASYQWASSDPAHPVTNSTGPSTTVAAPASGTFNVTLTVTDDAGKKDLATVTVGSTAATSSAPATAGTNACLTAIAVPSPVTVSVLPATGSLQAGSGTTQSFTATVADTLNTQVTWQVNTIAGGNATVGTISSAGIYTVPAMVPSPATVTVTAISLADATRSASAMVTITAAAAAPAPSSSGGGGGALDVLSLLALALAGLASVLLSPYNSRWAASSHGRCARR
jgi:serine protease